MISELMVGVKPAKVTNYDATLRAALAVKEKRANYTQGGDDKAIERFVYILFGQDGSDGVVTNCSPEELRVRLVQVIDTLPKVAVAPSTTSSKRH